MQHVLSYILYVYFQISAFGVSCKKSSNKSSIKGIVFEVFQEKKIINLFYYIFFLMIVIFGHLIFSTLIQFMKLKS